MGLILIPACTRKPEASKAPPAAGWPELTQFKTISGPAATAGDVAAGRAAFVAMHEATPVGTPMPIPLPQYAFYRDADSGARTRCIVIQAEASLGKQLLGAVLLPDRKMMTGFAEEFELRGQSPPPE